MEKILGKYANKIESFALIPGAGGVFEFSINDDLKFSKKALNRFPEDAEIFKLVSGA